MSKCFEFEMQGEAIQVRGRSPASLHLGIIRFLPKRKEWIFYPAHNSAFSSKGLAEIKEFLEGQK